jgi:hypothetical protein
MRERNLYARFAHWPAIRRLLIVIACSAVVIWLCDVFVGCVELYAKQQAEWLSACEADGNKPYQCAERWERMHRGGE